MSGFRFLITTVLALTSLAAQDAFIGSYRVKDTNGNQMEWLRVYSDASTSVTPSSVNLGSEGVANGARRSLLSVEAAGRTFLLHASWDSHLRVYEYASGVVTEIGVKQPLNIRAMVLSPDRNTLYMGVRDPNQTNYGPTTVTANAAFSQIYSLRLSDLSTATPLPDPQKLMFELGSAASPNECYDLDIDPSGTRLIAACYGELTDPNGLRSNLTEIDTVGWSVKNILNLSPYVVSNGTLRIEPSTGSFAYLTLVGASAADGILTLDLAGGALKAGNQISGIVRGALEFHPSGRFAYTFGGPSSGGVIGRLDTQSGFPATTETVLPFNPGATYGGVVVTTKRLYTTEPVNTSVALVIRELNNAGDFINTASAVIFGLGDRSSGGTEGLAVAQQALVPVTAKVDPSLPTTLSVALNNLPAANSTSVFVPPATVLPLDAVLTPQPAAYTPNDARFSFLNWTKNTSCPTPSFSALVNPPTDGATAPGDTYCACFDKEWYVSLNVTGTGVCTNTALNGVPLSSGGIWVKEGTTVKGSGNGPSGGTISISPDVVADAAGKSITITCTGVVNPPGCIPPPKSGNLLTWYTFDETASPAVNRGAGPGHPGNWVGSPTPLSAGRVNGALRFNGSNYVEAANAAEADLTAGNFSIDLWIRTTAANGVQTFLDKRELSSRIAGYSFYLGNGRPAIQLADGTGTSPLCSTAATSACTNWGAPATAPNVADGQWHFLVVTVDRASPTGGKFYVDANLVGTFDPRPRQGSLSNTARLRLGNHASSGQFNGDLDELEIFNTVLDPTEITALFNAGSAGKCRNPLPPIPTRKVTIVNQGCPAYTATPADTSGVASVLNGNSFGVNVSVPPPFQLDSLTATGGTRTGNSLNIAAVTSDLTVTMRCSANQCLQPASLPNMIGWYPLDETTMPPSVSLAGAKVDAWWWGVTPASDVITGKVGRALRFQGLSNIEAGVPTAYDFSGPEMSFDLWARFTDSGRMTILDKRTVAGGQQTGYELFVNGGIPGFSLYSGANVRTASATAAPINDNQWHLIVVTVRQTVGTVDITFYIDGQPAGFAGMLPPVGGTLVNPAPFRIGRNSTVLQGQPGWYRGDADEVEIFDRVLTATEALQLFAAGANGKCKPAAPAPTAQVVVNTNRPGTNMIVGVDSQPGFPHKVEPWGPNPVAVGLQTITAPNQHPEPTNSSIRHDFREWFYNGTLMTSPPKPHVANQAVSVPPSGGVYTAQYDTMYFYTVVNNGCAATSFETGWYKDGVLPRAIGTPGPGKRVTTIVVEWPPSSGGGAAPPPYSNNSDLGVNPPGSKITFNCADDVIQVTVNTNLATVAGTSVLPNAVVGILPPGAWAGTGGGTYTTSTLPNGTGITVRAPEIITNLAGDTRWVFQNWSRNGNAAGTGTTSGGVVTLVVPAPVSGDVFTANYQLQYRFVVNANGNCTVSPATGFHPGLVNLPITVTPASSAHTATLTVPPNAPFNYPINPPASIGLQGGNWVLNVTCAPSSVTTTLVTSPASIGANVSITLSGVPFGATGTNTTSITSGPTGQLTLGAASPVISGGAYYTLKDFTVQGTTTPPVGPTLPAPAADTTYVANYTLAGYVLTLNNSGGCAVSVQTANRPPLLTSPLVYPVPVNLTVAATAPSGQVVQSIRVQDAAGNTVTTGATRSFTMNGATTVTPTCGTPATVVVVVNTSPANLGATVGINGVGSLPNSYTNTVPANTAIGLSAPAVAVNANGEGYEFVNWTPAGPGVTTPASGSVTYTANYRLRCYMVLWETNPANTGTATYSPAPVAGFPTTFTGKPGGCYAMGTGLTVNFTPAAGRVHDGWLPHAGGSGQSGPGPYAFSVTGPTLLTARTSAAPAPAPALNWIYQSRAGGNLSLGVRNTGTAGATNVRVLSVSAISNGFAYSGPALPFTVPGASTLAPNALAGFNFPFTRASGANTAPFSFTITVEAQGIAPYNVTINVP